MATTGTKPKTKTQFAVTLVIEGSRLETMSKRAKEAFGDSLLRVENVEKGVLPGDWTLTEENPEGLYRNKVWKNADGREIVWKKPYEEDGVQFGDEYRVRDQWGRIGEFKSLEEAKAATRPIITPKEIQSMADELALRVASADDADDDYEPPTELADKYLSARRIERRYEEDDAEKTKAQSEYIVTLRIKGSTLPAVTKKAEAAWGDRVKKISHVRRSSTNQNLLDDAKEMVEGAAEIIAELHGAMEEHRDNTPENFQGNETYSAVEEAVDALESLESEIDGILPSFDNVEFPGF